MSGPSDKAVEAAKIAIEGRKTTEVRAWHTEELHSDADAVLTAAHDPALGLDRSVCLRDVVESVRMLRGTAFSADDIADLIEREFA